LVEQVPESGRAQSDTTILKKVAAGIEADFFEVRIHFRIWNLEFRIWN